VALGEPALEWPSDEHRPLAIEVKNVGYLPTYVPETARDLPHTEPLVATLDGVAVSIDAAVPAREAFAVMPRRPVITSPARVDIGHLAGWGRGRFGALDSLFYAASRGTQHKKLVRFSGRGRGRLRLGVGSARVGFVTRELELSESA
jgi:hypothetical protein